MIKITNLATEIDTGNGMLDTLLFTCWNQIFDLAWLIKNHPEEVQETLDYIDVNLQGIKRLLEGIDKK